MIKQKTISLLMLVSLSLGMLASPLNIWADVSALNYAHSRIATAESWAYGQDEYWHLVPVNEKNIFRTGEKVQFFAQIGPVYTWHQWKMTLMKNGNSYREVINDPFNPEPACGWNYSNFVPYMTDLPAGNYQVNYYLNTGSGYNQLGSLNFDVTEPVAKYTFHHAVTATSWHYGNGDDYWNLLPINQKTQFNTGEKVYLMVQTRSVYADHRYKVELYRDNNKLWEYSTDWLNVGSGWAYSNFYPYYDNARAGNYTFKSYIDVGQGYTQLASTSFSVCGPIEQYEYNHTYIAPGWQYGTGGDYWNLQPVDPRTTYAPGDKVYALSQVSNIYVNHQWKAELYRSGTKIWEYSTDWLNVGAGWTYGNFYPYYENAQPGNYEFKIFINTGDGFKLLDTKGFTVTGQSGDYTYHHAAVAAGWQYGSGADFWNIQPVDPRTSFGRGEDVYLVAQARNVYVDHRWKVETYRSGTMLWNYATNWNRVGTGWAYSNFYPANFDSAPGNYEFKLYIDSGNGFNLLDTKTFTVSNCAPNADGTMSTSASCI